MLCIASQFIWCMEKKLGINYTRMQRTILNKSWKQHRTKQQLYGHLTTITKTIQRRRTRHVEHCWRSKDRIISDILRWTPLHGRAKGGWPARTYIQQLCANTRCSLKDLPGAMDDRNGWRERIREIRAAGAIRWFWWYLIWKSHRLLPDITQLENLCLWAWNELSLKVKAQLIKVLPVESRILFLSVLETRRSDKVR